MATPIVLADIAYEPVEVNLWGTLFETVALTRSVQTAIREVLDGEDDAKSDDAEVDLIAATLDLRLKPKGESKKKASAVVKAKWKADEVTKVRLYQLLGQIEEADHPI